MPLFLTAPFEKSRRIYKLENGFLSSFYERTERIYSVAVGPRNEVYFVNAGKNFIYRLDANGSETPIYEHNTYVRFLRGLTRVAISILVRPLGLLAMG